MRQLEPFSYFADYASAVSGFGGSEPAPDNRYCLHTQYQPLRPGRAAFRLTITGARATKGELSLRVHAYKPSSSGDAVLAGGGRIRLDELKSDTIDKIIRFAAAPGVHYALYGYFSEPTDLVAELMVVAIEEHDGEEANTEVQEIRRSVLADAAPAIDRSNRLCTGNAPSVALPVSQPCTADQLAARTFGQIWPEIPSFADAPSMRWQLVMPLQALENFGLIAPGSHGLLVDPPHDSLATTLRQRNCILEEFSAHPDGKQEGFGPLPEHGASDHDFAIGFEPIALAIAGSFRESMPERLLSHLMKGGVAITTFIPGENVDANSFRNRLQQIALRLVGLEHDVAQLCFPRQAEGNWASAPFIFIVRK